MPYILPRSVHRVEMTPSSISMEKSRKRTREGGGGWICERPKGGLNALHTKAGKR